MCVRACVRARAHGSPLLCPRRVRLPLLI
eukprot:COSAG01_NODE_76398_length_185_cov_52.441860_1_plen_28_part_01